MAGGVRTETPWGYAYGPTTLNALLLKLTTAQTTLPVLSAEQLGRPNAVCPTLTQPLQAVLLNVFTQRAPSVAAYRPHVY